MPLVSQLRAGEYEDSYMIMSNFVPGQIKSPRQSCKLQATAPSPNSLPLEAKLFLVLQL